jgi:hypothetical protein
MLRFVKGRQSICAAGFIRANKKREDRGHLFFVGAREKAGTAKANRTAHGIYWSLHSLKLLNSAFLLLTRFNPSKKTIRQTAAPTTPLNIHILISDIFPNDTSIERCKVKIETKALARDILRKVTSFAKVLFRALTKLMMASVIFVKE